MKYPKAIVFALLGFAPAAAGATETVFGVWSRDGHPEQLEFYDCAGKLCAKGTRPMLDGSPAPVVLRNAPKIASNQWKGDLFNPEDGKTYTGTITLDAANKMTLKGCLIAFLCKSETWTRVPAKAPTASAKTPAAAQKPVAPAPAPAPAKPAPKAEDADE